MRHMKTIDDLIEYLESQVNRFKDFDIDFIRMWSYEDALEKAEELKTNMEKNNE